LTKRQDRPLKLLESMVRGLSRILQSAVSVFALGLNHTTAPLDLRGRLAFAPEQTPALRGLRERLQRAMPEAALVSTCNRTELYVAPTRQRRRIWCARRWTGWPNRAASAADQLQQPHLRAGGPGAARHAFRVAAGSIRWCWASRRSWAR
jgi:glutamyl-tRNA reductase